MSRAADFWRPEHLSPVGHRQRSGLRAREAAAGCLPPSCWKTRSLRKVHLNLAPCNDTGLFASDGVFSKRSFIEVSQMQKG